MEDYRAANLANWDERAPAHAASPGYHFADFLEDPDFLSHVVRFDLPRLGDVRGLRGVHLQCHIGTDTLSLSRLGAQMTGLDFSSAALAEARRLAAAIGSAIDYVESDLYDAVSALGAGRFDLVYTGVGALCWLPHIDRWAGVVADLLSPGGRLFLREGHPMFWSLAVGRADDLLVVDNPYFEREEPYVDDDASTYVPTDVVFTQRLSYDWNHGLGEVITALLERGLTITGFVEHDSVPWNGLPGLMEEVSGDEYRLIDRPWRVAHSYTLQAVKAPLPSPAASV